VTGREFSEVDIDLLADYVGGALDGTPDEAVVAALVADDATWRSAHETLATGMTAVAGDLRVLGAEPLPMPDDVTARLTAALTAEARPPLRAVPDLDTTDDAQPAALPLRPVRRRGPRRWAAPVAAAAAALAFVGFGVQQFWGAGVDESQSDATAAARGGDDGSVEENAPMIASDAPGLEQVPPAAAAAGAPAVAPPPGRITTSNLDYDRAALRGPQTFMDPLSPPQKQPSSPVGADSDSSRRSTAGALSRLTDPVALQACLEAVARELAAGPITVDTVDYARFDGAPALIVRFAAENGSWAWASGPECGSTPADADTRYRVKVG
jgi:hypothetical protein